MLLDGLLRFDVVRLAEGVDSPSYVKTWGLFLIKHHYQDMGEHARHRFGRSRTWRVTWFQFRAHPRTAIPKVIEPNEAVTSVEPKLGCPQDPKENSFPAQKGTHEANLMLVVACWIVPIGARPLPLGDRVNRKRGFPIVSPSRVPGHSHYIPEIILYSAAAAARAIRAIIARDISRTKLVFLFWIKLITALSDAMRTLPSLLLLCGGYGGTAIE